LGQQLISSLIEFAKLNRHEPDVVARLKQIHGNVFWDIGANIGFYSFLLRKNFKRIIAVEPNPRTAYMLRKRINFFRVHNVEVKELALSNRRDWASFYSGREWYAGPGLGNLLSGISNLYSSDSLRPRTEHRSTFRVWTERFDDIISRPVDLVKLDVEPELLVLEGMENEKRPSFQVLQRSFDELSVGSVDLVKIDVEGAEFLVLEGMRNSLQNRSIKRILVELHNREDKTRLESIFVPCGYTVEWVDPDHLFATIR